MIQPTIGRPPKDHQRPYVYARTAKTGRVTWYANVRDPEEGIIYLGGAGTRQEAETISQRFIDTGERPPAKQRGRKPGQRDRSQRTGMPHQTGENRCQAVARKREGKVPTTALECAPAPREGSRPPAAGKASLTYEQRIEMMRRIARRLG